MEILNTDTPISNTSWTEVDIPGSVPTSAKVVHLQYRIARRAAFFVTYDNSALPQDTSNKYILGDAGGEDNIRGPSGASGQTTTRFDRDTRKIYFALDPSRALWGAPPNVTVDIIGWGE